MLGDFQFRFGQVVDLAALDAVRLLAVQGPAAIRAAFDAMGHDPVGLLDHAQRMPRMARLPARGPLAFRAQALRFGLGQSIGRRRLVAVVRVLGDLLLERLDLRLQLLDAVLQGMDAPVHIQQHTHDGFLARAIDRLRIFPGHHAHNSRRKSAASAYK
jgi:hypothetical protein